MKYVTGYTQWDATNSEGNFLALSFEDSDADKIECDLEGGRTSGTFSDATEDKYVVFRITTPATQKVVLRFTKDGKMNEKKYSLTGLTLDPKSGEDDSDL